MPTRLAALTPVLVLAAGPAVAAPLSGEAIYKTQCASCHGPAGEGVKGKYPHALAGDNSPAQLSKVISKTMPEDAPGTCVGADADAVAKYVHDTFYSKAAREKNAPPRVELARLTVRQYRHAVAEVIGAFRPFPKAKWDDKRGLKGEYYSDRNFRQDKRVLERFDGEVRFDWKLDGPVPGKTESSPFAVRWSGSVLAPETGEYEFVVKADQAMRLYVNDTAKPLIDAWVRSGPDTEFRGSIYLVGGRVYPLRLEFSKAKQGVTDPKLNKPLVATPASVALLWKPPGAGVATVVPAGNLSPNPAPEGFAVTTPFPPDDRSYGWERGTAVSKAWDGATTDAALETAAYVTAKLVELSGAKPDAADRAAKVKLFAARFAERAFRRPLTADETALYVDRQFAATKGDADAAVKRVVLLVLKSPRFLYREVGHDPDGYDVAARLSFALWDSLPDDDLLKAAATGKLATREQVSAQAERMLADPRATAKLRGFLHQWLKVDPVPDVSKDPKKFPGFDPAIVADLRASLDRSLDDVLANPAGDFRTLLTGDDVYLNGRLAKFYGAKLPADAPFQKVKLDAGKRAGVLTHPYLMASFAYTGTTSPIHRGVFLARGVLGLSLRPPPEAFSPLAPDLHPTLTTRERVLLQTKPAACQTCHGTINALGFTLEHFDAVGRYRMLDNGKSVDDSGSYQTRDGKTETFRGPAALGAFLAGSGEVHAAFAEQLFHHLAQQPVRAYGTATLDGLRAAFGKSGFSVRKLAVEVATTAALTGRGGGKELAAKPATVKTSTGGK